MGAFDEARDVCQDEALLLVHGHDAEVWYQGCERIVGNLGTRVRNGRDQSGLAGVGVAHQADVRQKFQLQLQPTLLAARAGIASGRHAIGRGGEAGVAASAASALRDRKSTRLNSSHGYISYAVFCLKKKKEITTPEFAGS